MDKGRHRKLSILAWETAAKTYLAVGLLLLGFAALFVVMDFNSAVGPVRTLNGKVVGITMDGSGAYHVPREIARVALPNGTEVDAAMPSGLAALAGDAVRVAVYRYRLSGSLAYQVVRVEMPDPAPRRKAP